MKTENLRLKNEKWLRDRNGCTIFVRCTKIHSLFLDNLAHG